VTPKLIEDIVAGQGADRVKIFLGPPCFSKNLKLHVNDPAIGDKFGVYQKLFGEIFGAKQ
jgi:hypothetical protein